MFAFAIWDARQQALFLARDRLGKKPLLYASLPDRLVFASEAKAILRDPGLAVQPDLQAIHYYLTYQSVPAPYSAFAGIQRLPPAHTLLVQDGRRTLRRYWRLSYVGQRRVRTETDRADLRHEIMDRFTDAVRARLVSDVPLGTLLSGGVDSSLVSAVAATLSSGKLKTFSIGFEESEYDETKYARLVAARYGTDHHELVVHPDAAAIFPDLVWHYNEPFADPSAIPTYYVCKLAREHVTVVLTGDGGDENFAGYPRYQWVAPAADSAPHFDGAAMARRRLAGLLGRSARPHTWRARWRELTRPVMPDARRWRYYQSFTHFHEELQRQLYTPGFYDLTRRWPAVGVMLQRYGEVEAPTLLDQTMGLDFGLYLPDTLMPKVDIASMAHSLEARMPFLDHRFVEFCATIPASLKLTAAGDSKAILKQASAPWLPREVIDRPKMGFGVPLDHWFRDDLRELAFDTLTSKRATDRGYFDPTFVRTLIERHLSGTAGSWATWLWNLLMLELWHLMFIDRTLAPPASASLGEVSPVV